MDKYYYVYMIRCEDNSLYTGMTTDLERRLKEHLERGEKCAKYTSNHHAKKMEVAWRTSSRRNALRLEYYIKTLKKSEKEELISNNKRLEDYLSEKVNCEEYTYMKI